MSDGSRRTLSLERLIILGVALALIAAGLWLAVGAGTSTGESARTAAYPSPTFHFQVTLSCKPPKKTTSHKAKLCFDTKADPGYESQLQYLHGACQLDTGPLADCSSPKKYKKLRKGRHTFAVRAYYFSCGSPGTTCDASSPTTYGWKVK